jgi:alkanesulfonate monooxygenase
MAPADAAAQFRRVTQACERVGRDPAAMRLSSAVVVCCGTDTAEIERRAGAIGREVGELRQNGACGTPSEVADRIGEWVSAGASRIYLQVLDLADLDHVRLIGREVAPLLA